MSWLSYGAMIWGTLFGDEADRTGGEFIFEHPDTEIFDPPNPDGETGGQHVQVEVWLEETTPGHGVYAEVIVGWLNDENYLVAGILSFTAQSLADGVTAPCKLLVLYKRDTLASDTNYTDLVPVSVVPIQNFTFQEWHILDVCLEPNVYGDYLEGDLLRAHLTLGADRDEDAQGHVRAQGYADNYTTGAFAGLAMGYSDLGDNTVHGKVKFRHFKFNHLRHSPEYLTCPNCNDGPCLVFAQDFAAEPDAEADADGKLGCFWVDTAGATGGIRFLSGTFEIEPGKTARCLIPHPTNKGSKAVSVPLVWHAGAIIRISLGGSGYAILRSDSATISIYDNADVLLDTDTTIPADSGRHTVEVCWRGGVLSATFDSSACVMGAASADTSNPWIYLGAEAGSAAVHFLAITFEKANDTNSPSDAKCDRCARCSQTCDGSNACCTDPQTVGPLVVDFGIGGWTTTTATLPPFITGECDACATIAGEIVIQAPFSNHIGAGVNSCIWGWESDDCAGGFRCDAPGGDDNEHHGQSYVGTTASVVLIPFGDPDYGVPGKSCRWVVTARANLGACDTVGSVTKCDGMADNSEAFVVYYSEPIGADECNIFPVTLTKSTVGIGCPCQGDLPTTIVLDQA